MSEEADTKDIAVPDDPIERRTRRSEVIPERAVPNRLRLDKQGRARAAELQASLANTRARLSPEERRLQAARGREAATRATLTSLWEVWAAESGAMSEEDRARLAADIERVSDQFADAVAEQGDYATAIRFSHGEARNEYRRILRAIEKPDEERCDCPDDTARVDGRTVSLSPRFTEKMVVSERHGGRVHLVVCNKCLHTNARPSTGRLEEQRAAQVESARAARGGALVEPKPDSEILKS